MIGVISMRFLDLTDTPASMTGEAGKVPKVTVAEDSLDWSDGKVDDHHARHGVGEDDEINLTGLSGETVTPQPPKAHQSSHNSGGSDALKLDDLSAPDDNTDLDASTSKHGLLRKLDNDVTHFLNGQGNLTVPPAEVGGHVTVLGPSYSSITQGTWQIAANAAQFLCGYLLNTTQAQNDRVNYKLVLGVGTYTFVVVVLADGASGILHLLIDGNEVGTVDCYSGVSQLNFMVRITGITIAVGGLKEVSFLMSTKNPNASKYTLYLSYFSFFRTA
jgi:hypothetical protein